ncbi:MAG TPA: hypothetical protein VG245_10415 [Candidatus Dormibacteraeota bacterium]|jgi:hypothetical protein|nr:hypothetical protein [Candidatus Dormibacteraeota bacterium]
MTTTRKQSLSLTRETVRELAGRDLDGIEGGVQPTPPVMASLVVICPARSDPGFTCSGETCI